MRVTKPIGPLIGGVSQTPAHLRAPEYATELVNSLAYPSLGATKRPGTRHLLKLANSSDGHYSSASIFDFVANDKQRYFLSVSAGALRVVEADTGVERVVNIKGDALDYISGFLEPDRPFDAAVTGNVVYLVNRAKQVKRGTKSAAARSPEALVFVRSADVSTRYAVVINGRDVGIVTAGPDSAIAPTTEGIATALGQAIENATSGAFTVTRSGPVLHLKLVGSGAFTVTAAPSMESDAMTVTTGSLESEILIPPSGVVDGVTLRIIGDARSSRDDYWLCWQSGRWRECARPGSLISLDATTLPHSLMLDASLHDGLVVPEVPAQPSVSSGGVSVPLDWTSGTVGSGSLILHGGDQGDALLTEPDGTATVRVNFSLDTTQLTDDYNAIVTLQRIDTSLTVTDIATGTYYSTDSGLPLSLSYTGAFAAGDTLRLKLVVDPAIVSPPGPPGLAELVVQPTGASLGDAAGLVYSRQDSTRVSILSGVTFPALSTVSVTVDGTTITTTIPQQGFSGADVAAALKALWVNGAVTCIDLGGGILSFRNVSTGTPPVVTAAFTSNPLVLYVPGLPFVAGALVGLPVLNVTTGATGTVTANGTGSLTVSALSGGSSAALRIGDVVRVYSAPGTFTFMASTWDDRAAGDDDSNPFPSFVGRTISDLAVEQNRLIIVAGDNVIASAAAKFGRFFRTTTQQVLDNDVIDVRGTASRGLAFIHTVEWNGGVNLFNGRSIYSLDGEPTLTPRSVSFNHVFEVSVDARCAPLVVGRTLYIARVKNGRTQLLALEAAGQGVGVDSVDASAEIPEYLIGEPVALAADEGSPLILVTEDGATRYVYAMQPISLGRAMLHSWSRWTLDAGAKPLALALEGGDLLLIIQRADGVYLESVDTLAHLT